MTHNELLEKIDEQEFAYDYLAKAVMAIVELHKPETHLNEQDLWCAGCYPTNTLYPCPTIQAIEKELG